jgi:hypothetical protein
LFLKSGQWSVLFDHSLFFLQKFEKSGQKWPEKMAKSPLFLKSGHPLKPSDCNGFRGLVAKNPLFSLINVKKKINIYIDRRKKVAI